MISETMTLEIIRAAPAALWVLFALFVFLALRSVIRDRLTHLSTVRTGTVEMSFAEPLLEAARVQDGGGVSTDEPGAPAPSASESRAAVSRLEHAAEYLAEGRILWVDDHPEWNSSLATLFRKAGMTVDSPRSTTEAMQLLTKRSYDLIITDMTRHTEEPAPGAAYTLLDSLVEHGARTPVILFSSSFDSTRGVPFGLFAYTSSGDNLVQYVIDVMERVKFGVGMRIPSRGARPRSDAPLDYGPRPRRPREHHA